VKAIGSESQAASGGRCGFFYPRALSEARDRKQGLRIKTEEAKHIGLTRYSGLIGLKNPVIQLKQQPGHLKLEATFIGIIPKNGHSDAHYRPCGMIRLG
jgi:hypothetical protein